ncbi:MAG: VWA domain-containing protein [Coraliomargaritaceae bacterium]
MTRPQAPYSTNIQTADGVAIQLLIDVSSSMDMTLQGLEERKSRLEIAKEMVERFIVGDDEKLTGRSNDLIGLITFARYADTRSPLTLGHQALVQIIQNLKIQERPNEDGTAYGDALALAAARLHKMEELNQKRKEEASIQSRVIILLTDGENNSGAHLPIEAAGLAKKWDCRIYTISLGDKAQKYDENLSDSALSASEQILSYISEQTGGVFRKAHDYKSLFSVYREIDRLETSKITTRSLEMTREWFWLPLSIALGCLLCALTLEATWLRITP